MPFRKISKDRWASPSGKTYTKDQLALYYMTNGFKDMKTKEKK